MGPSEPNSYKIRVSLTWILFFWTFLLLQERREIRSLEGGHIPAVRSRRQVNTVANNEEQLPEGSLHEMVNIMAALGAFRQVAGSYGAISSAASLGWEVLNEQVSSSLLAEATSNGVAVCVCAESNSEGWSVTSRQSAHTSLAMECWESNLQNSPAFQASGNHCNCVCGGGGRGSYLDEALGGSHPSREC